MIRDIIEKLDEGKKFHPIDVFGERWVITDGKEIMSPETGEIVSIERFKKDMKTSRIYNKFDYIYYPSEALAKEAFMSLGDNKGKFKVKKLSYQ